MTSCYYVEEKMKIKNAENYDDNLKETVFFPEQFNQIGKIYYFIKVYGFLKVHSNKARKNIDELFFEYYPQIKENIDKKDFNAILDTFVSEAFKTVPETTLVENARYSWLNDTTYFCDNIKKKLLFIERNFVEKRNKSIYYEQNYANIIRPKIRYKPADINSFFPSEDTRIWGIANHWNLVNYFWVYKNLMDADWDKVLYETIPAVWNAQNEIEYNIAVMKYIACTDDSHSYVYSTIIDSVIFGRYVPNITLDMINDTVIVKKRRTDRTVLYSDTVFKSGDIIYSINNIPIIKLYDSLQCFQSASNEKRRKKQTLSYTISSFQKYNKIIYSRNEQFDTVMLDFDDYATFNRVQYRKVQEKENKITVQNKQGTGYIHIDELFEQNFKQNTNELKKYNEIIIDMRGYPNPKISMKISGLILEKSVRFNDYLYPYIYHPGKIKRVKGRILNGKNEFNEKKIALLVDETTLSQAEFLTMILQTNENVTVIGSKTAGADGPVITIELPGKISVGLTSAGILYPDGTKTQRIGIIRDIEIKPTIEGIKAGKDEILEKAIEWLQQK
jgi:C-terminal processing protease CtpA/Prc